MGAADRSATPPRRRTGSEFRVVKEFTPLRSNPAGELRVRVIEMRPGDRRLDVRLFVQDGRYTGPTKKGVLLSYEELRALLEQREVIEAALEGRR